MVLIFTRSGLKVGYPEKYQSIVSKQGSTIALILILFIDLESFRSFDFIFDGSPKHFENFDLNAWWKPLETAQRDVNKFFKSCFSDCLGIDLDFNIDSRENFERAYATLVERFPTGASL